MPRSRVDAEVLVDKRLGSRARLPGAIGWLIITPLAVCAAARMSQFGEASSVLLLAAGLTPLLGPPALVVLGMGLQKRRGPLTIVSAATAGVLVSSTLAGTGLPDRVRPPAGAVPKLRVFSANIHHANPDVGRLAKEILADAPDIVGLQEVDPDGAEGLRRSGVLRRFPYAVTETRNGASGIALWSRFPLVDTKVQDVHGMPFIRATMVLGARQIRLYVVHMVAPLGQDRVPWRAQLRRVEAEIRGESGPLVVAGDFNATRYHRSFRRLLSDRLADAHEERGRGLAATWPRDQWPLPPLMRLDHILVSPDIDVLSVREGLGQGSDHRPIIADLALLP
jgi:endonuclease/exonuclease/phosphatase family metal-dependent hydrolase